eukprot:3417990-Amphidinium_carterae.2
MVIAVDIGCALHDLHNSLKWCYQSLFPDTDEALQNMCIGFNTLKSGMSVVLHALGGWLMKTLLPLGEAELPSHEELVEFFSALEVAGADVEVLSACKLLWCPLRQKPMVSGEFLHLHCRKCEHVVSSAGSSIVCGSTFGMANGYPITEIQMSSVLGGLTSYAPESLMADLNRDGRLMQQIDVFELTLNEKCHYLEHLTASFWTTLGGLVALQPTVLRDMVIRGMQTIRGYIELNIFSVAQQYPWSLATRNLAENVST